MNEHFYNGFIKRAQAYGLSAVEAERLAKVAGMPSEADRNDAMAMKRTPAPAAKPSAVLKPFKPTPAPKPAPKPAPSADDLASRAASKSPVSPLQAETARLMRANNK